MAAATAIKAKEGLGTTGAPLSQIRVQVWHYAVLSSIVGAPFALLAVWFAVVKP